MGQRLVDCCWALVSAKAQRTAERGLDLALGWSLSDPPGPDAKETVVNFLKLLLVCEFLENLKFAICVVAQTIAKISQFRGMRMLVSLWDPDP